MDISHAFLYGLIQGLAEFLPISSSGHLALLPHFFNISDPGVAFDLFMHVGTALSVLLYFRKEVAKLIKNSLTLFSKNPDPFTLNFVLSTFITLIVVIIFKDTAEEWGRQPRVIAINLIVFGFLLMISDKCKSDQDKKFSVKSSSSLRDAILMGLAQGIAVFPGVSRSGATITMGRWLSFSKREASAFSFLLSLPLILGGMIFKAKDLMEGQASGAAGFIWSTGLVGLVTSFLTGLLTIHLFLGLIKRIGFEVFFIYRLLLALLLFYLF
jgi:undecaprenyl-diphosphatase